MTPMMKRKKFELGSWQLIKPTAPCKTIFPYKQIHRNNKINFYKTLIKPILCYGSVAWTLTQTAEQMLNTFEILRRIHGPTQDGGRWRPRALVRHQPYSTFRPAHPLCSRGFPGKDRKPPHFNCQAP